MKFTTKTVFYFISSILFWSQFASADGLRSGSYSFRGPDRIPKNAQFKMQVESLSERSGSYVVILESQTYGGVFLAEPTDDSSYLLRKIKINEAAISFAEEPCLLLTQETVKKKSFIRLVATGSYHIAAGFNTSYKNQEDPIPYIELSFSDKNSNLAKPDTGSYVNIDPDNSKADSQSSLLVSNNTKADGFIGTLTLNNETHQMAFLEDLPNLYILDLNNYKASGLEQKLVPGFALASISESSFWSNKNTLIIFNQADQNNSGEWAATLPVAKYNK